MSKSQRKIDLFKVGDILRYSDGPTALMRVTYISRHHGGSEARYYSQQCMGGSCGAYHQQVQLASAEDRKTWFRIGRKKDIKGRTLRTAWKQLYRGDRGIIGAVEDR